MKRAMKTALAVMSIAIVLLALIAACGGESVETPASEDTSTSQPPPGQTQQPADESGPESTRQSSPRHTQQPADESAPEPTARPDSERAEEPTDEPARQSGGLFSGAGLSVEEYADLCASGWGLAAELGEELQEATVGDVAELYPALIDEIESVEPPDEVADWHQANLDGLKLLKEALDDYSAKDDLLQEVMDEANEEFNQSLQDPERQLEGTEGMLLWGAAFGFAVAAQEAIKEIHPSTLAVMVSAGCIDEQMVSLRIPTAPPEKQRAQPAPTARQQAEPAPTRSWKYGDLAEYVGHYAELCGQSYFDLSFDFRSDSSDRPVTLTFSYGSWIDARPVGTFEEESAFHEQLIDRFDSLDPPGEFAEWHQAYLDVLKGIKAVLDDYPGLGDDLVKEYWGSILEDLFSSIDESYFDLEHAVEDMSQDVREALAAAGCATFGDYPAN